MKKTILLTLCFSALFFCFSAIPALAAETETNKIFDEIKNIKPAPSIELPGLNFSQEPKVVEQNGTTFLYIPYFGEYMAAIYKYAVIVAGILAVIIIMFGGFTWLTSGGNPEKITEAKKYITGAVIGLIIASGSYALLYTINPNLVQFKNLKVAYTEGKNLEPLNELVNPTGETFTGVSTFGANGIPDLKQCDEKWGNSIYGNESTCTTICKGGCGITSLADVLNYYGHQVGPTDTANYSVKVGARKCNKGTNGVLLCQKISTEWTDLSCRLLKPGNLSEITQLLRDKKPIVFSCHSCVGFKQDGSVITFGGHFMVLTGVDTNGTYFSVNDPGRRNGMIKIASSEFQTDRIATTFVIEKK